MGNNGNAPAMIFDLDGTLVDSVYQHAMAWYEAFLGCGIEIQAWQVHRRVGMNGEMLTRAILREEGMEISEEQVTMLRELHTKLYAEKSGDIRPLRGARELLAHLSEINVPWAIATSSKPENAKKSVEKLGVGADAVVVTGETDTGAKPDPGLFLVAAKQLGIAAASATIVGDSVWDMLAARRTHALGVGLLCGGYSTEELRHAGGYRVYRDPLDLLRHLEEVGLQP
jgi:HAD superfamily hydrolase (TIGR01549 family)